MDNDSTPSISEQLERLDNIEYALRRTVTMKRLYGQYCYDLNLQVYFPKNESPSNTSIDRIQSLSEDELRERDEMTDQIANINNNNFKPNPIHSDTELDAKRFTRQDCIEKLSKLNINLNDSREDEIESIVSEYFSDSEQPNRSRSGSEDSLRNYGYYNSEEKYLQTIKPHTGGNTVVYYQGCNKYKYCRMSPPKDGPDRNVFMIREKSRRSSAAETISEYLNKHDRKSKKAGRFSNDSDTSSSDKCNGNSNNNFDRKESTCNKRKCKSSQGDPSQISADTLDDVDQMPTTDTTKYPHSPIYHTDNFIFNSKGHVNYNIINDLYNDSLSDKSNKEERTRYAEKEMKRKQKDLKREREKKIQNCFTRKIYQEMDYENQKRIKKPSKNNMLFSRNNNQRTDSEDSEHRERQKVNQKPSKSNLLFNRVKTPYYQKERLKIETKKQQQDNNVYTTPSGNNLLFNYRKRDELPVQKKDEKNVLKIKNKLPRNDIKEENKKPSNEMIKSFIENKRKREGQGDAEINKNQALDVKNLFTKLINIKHDSKKEKEDAKYKKKSKKESEVYEEEINKRDLKQKILQFKKTKVSDIQIELDVVNKSQKDKNKIGTHEWNPKCKTEVSHLGYKFPKRIKERHENNRLVPVDLKKSNYESLNIASNSESYASSTNSDEWENSSTNTKLGKSILGSSSLSLSEWERNYRENYKVALKKNKQGKANSDSKKTSSSVSNDWQDKHKTNCVATKKHKHNKSNSPKKIIEKISSSFSTLSLSECQDSPKKVKVNTDTKISATSLSFNEWWEKRKKKSEVEKQKLINSRNKKSAQKSSSYSSIYSVEWQHKFEKNRPGVLKKIKKVKGNRGTKKTSSSLALNDWSDISAKIRDDESKNVQQNKNHSGNKRTVKKSSSYSSILSIAEKKEKCTGEKVKKVKRNCNTKKTSSNEWEKLEKPDEKSEATKKDSKENKNNSGKKKVKKVNRNSGSNKTSSSLSFNEWLEKSKKNSEAAMRNVTQNKKNCGGKKNVKKSSSDSSICVVEWPEKSPEKVKTVKDMSGTKKVAKKLSTYNSKALSIWPQERKKNCKVFPKRIKENQSNSGDEKIQECKEKRKKNCKIALKDDKKIKGNSDNKKIKKIDDNTYSSNSFVCLNGWEDINEEEVTQEELTDNNSNICNKKIKGFISVKEWEAKNEENEEIQEDVTVNKSNCGNKKISEVSVISFNTWVNNYDDNFDIGEIYSNPENKKIKKHTSSSSSLFSLNEWLDKCEEKCEVALIEARKNKSRSRSKDGSSISNTSIDIEEEICRKNLEQLQKEFEDLERRLSNQESLKQIESSSRKSLKSCVKVTQENCKVAESKKSVSSKNTEYENDVFEDDQEDIKISKYSGPYLVSLNETLQKLGAFLKRGEKEIEKTSSNSINDDCELTNNLELNDEPGQNQIKVQVEQPWEGERIALVRTTSAPVINSSEFTIYSQTIPDSGIGTSFNEIVRQDQNDLKQVYFVRTFDNLRKTVSLSPQIVSFNPFRDNRKQTFQKELQFTEDFDLKFIVPPKQLSSSSEDSFQATLRNKYESRKKHPKIILNKNKNMKFSPSGTSDSTSENSFDDDSSRTNYGLRRIKNIRRTVRRFIRRQLYHISKVL